VNGTPDTLLGFASRLVEFIDSEFVAANGATHRTVQYTGRTEDGTAGTVLELTDADLAASDAYEPAGYRRIPAQFASGREGWVYADANASAATHTE
jgi:hypothetical protein